MDELLKKRILRKLDGLSDEKALQVLDYIEFLQSKYGDRSSASPLRKIADSVEDTLRAGRVPVAAIKGTMGVFDAAGRVMQGLADAGRSVVDELQKPTESTAGDEAVVKAATVDQMPTEESSAADSEPADAAANEHTAAGPPSEDAQAEAEEHRVDNA
jgi:hypothetical protein